MFKYNLIMMGVLYTQQSCRSCMMRYYLRSTYSVNGKLFCRGALFLWYRRSTKKNNTTLLLSTLKSQNRSGL